jgi:hypothetical protein
MRIEAYAVVGADDRIADATGVMPEALKNDAEWAFFQQGLDAADVTVLGRRSHDATPNHKRRWRLVLTRSVSGVERDGDVVFWNPDKVGLSAALNQFDGPVTYLAVAGGRDIFDYFLTGAHSYTAFHLSRIEGVNLLNGTGVFKGVETGETAADVLTASGYKALPRQILDVGVDVVSWVPDSM